MKKTLIASAVAAAALTSNAFAMDNATDIAEKLDMMPTIYGNIQLAHFWNEADNNGVKSGNHSFADGGSTIGFKHDHAISEGLTGFFKAEFHFDADDRGGANAGFQDGLDEAYIGVKGDFGSVQVGSDDTVYEDMINVLDTSEQIGLGANYSSRAAAGGQGGGEGDNFQYTGTFDSITVGLTRSIDDTGSNYGTQLAAQFAGENFTVAAGYHMARDASTAGGQVKGQDAIGLAASFLMGDLTLLAQYEMLGESQSNANDDADYMGVQAMYSMGQNTFALGYAMESYGFNMAEDESTIYLQALHSLSDNMYVYIEASSTTDVNGVNNSDNDATAIGATYAF